MKTNEHRLRFVKKLSEESYETVTEMWRKHPKSRARNRAQMIRLSHKGYKREEIADICRVDVDAVSRTFDRWEKVGLVGLLDRPKSGRPAKMGRQEQEKAAEIVSQRPHQPAQAQAHFEAQTGVKVHAETFRRSLKKSGLVWKRMRRSLKKKRKQAQFEQAQGDIAAYCEQEELGELDVYYFDESGFALNSSIPYGWQPRGTQTLLPADRGKRHNVLGFCNRFNQFFSHTVLGKVDSQRVIDCFNEFAPTLTRPTLVILDNAKIHRSAAFKEAAVGWEAYGLTLYYLPAYSPELNLIEIVWRFIKYHWLPLAAFADTAALSDALEHILSNIGTDDYRISFV